MSSGRTVARKSDGRDRLRVAACYLLADDGRDLYGLDRQVGGRQLGYGQHSFIADVLAGLVRRGGRTVLALAGAATAHPPIVPGVEVRTIDEEDVFAGVNHVFYDGSSSEWLRRVPDEVAVTTIVHNSWRALDEKTIARSTWVTCLSEVAAERLRVIVPPEKLRVNHQGVDLARFPVLPPGEEEDRRPVVVVGRLDGDRGAMLREVLDILVTTRRFVIHVGGGNDFWSAVERHGNEVLFANFVPYQSIPRLLSGAGLVVSSGRGAIEALVSGLPTICSGYGYGGPVTAANLPTLMAGNLTARGWGCSLDTLASDVEQLLDQGRVLLPGVRETLSVDRFVDQALRAGGGAT